MVVRGGAALSTRAVSLFKSRKNRSSATKKQANPKGKAIFSRPYAKLRHQS
jgi:hypothetical protein